MKQVLLHLISIVPGRVSFSVLSFVRYPGLIGIGILIGQSGDSGAHIIAEAGLFAQLPSRVRIISLCS